MKSDKTPQIAEHIAILPQCWLVTIKFAHCDPCDTSANENFVSLWICKSFDIFLIGPGIVSFSRSVFTHADNAALFPKTSYCGK